MNNVRKSNNLDKLIMFTLFVGIPSYIVYKTTGK